MYMRRKRFAGCVIDPFRSRDPLTRVSLVIPPTTASKRDRSSRHSGSLDERYETLRTMSLDGWVTIPWILRRLCDVLPFALVSSHKGT